jgi:hypothetical protein
MKKLSIKNIIKQNKMICMKKLVKLTTLLGLFILVQLTGTAQIQKQPYPSGELNLNELKAKFFQLCDVAVERLKIPDNLANVRKASQDLPERKVSFYMNSYAVRALAVAYDLTGKEEYLTTIKNWSDRMITFQEKMIPKGAYYMNYGRGPFETAGDWYVADCGEISMAVLATAVRCTNPMEKQRYLKSVEAYANLVLENYIGPNGGVTDGLWRAFNGESDFTTGFLGQVFFTLYDETGNKRYLDAALNAVNWLVNLETIRKNSKDSVFLKFNSDRASVSGGVMCILNTYNIGFPHIFSGKYPEIESLTRKELAYYMKWFSENLCGKGESGTFEKYDVRKPKVGGKFGGLPFHIYVLVQNKIFPNNMLKIADKELQRIVSEIFSYDKILITEFTSFSMASMAEKISPGSVLRKSEPFYKTLK